MIRPGKPDAPIYRLAFARAAEIRGAEVARGRTLAIGDGPATDMLGANRQGIDGLFIGSGIHGHGMASGEGFETWARGLLAGEGVNARYAMPELAW